MIVPTSRVSRFLAATRDASTCDAELLTRYVAYRDGAAFAALVVRHGPMVFGVCRRVLRDWHLAEDAFQATFLVLARRAETVEPPAAVVGWLHGVAFRVAQAARRAQLRRARREYGPGAVPDGAASSGPDTELDAVIDGEVQRLPGKYRELIVACDLEERPRRGVAAALGIPEGTLSSRLTAARKMLAGRLARHGVAPSLAALVSLGGPRLVACEVPQRALASAAKLGGGAGGTVPVAIAALASKASRTVSRQFLTPAALLALSACGAVCATLTAGGAPAPQPPAGPVPAAVRHAEPPAGDPKLAPKGPNKLLFSCQETEHRLTRLKLIDPDGRNVTDLPIDAETYSTFDPKVSPDGTMLAVLARDRSPESHKKGHYLFIRKLGDKDAVTALEGKCQFFIWSADGTRLACTDFEDPEKNLVASHFILDVKTKERTAVKLPSNHLISDWSRDGKYFLTTSFTKESFTKERAPRVRLHVMNRDGTEHKTLAEKTEFAAGGRFSPDGKRVLCFAVPPPPKGEDPWAALVILDPGTGHMTKVGGVPKNTPTSLLNDFCWSPDGKKIAYLLYEFVETGPIDDWENIMRVVVCDPDGANARTVITSKIIGGRGNTHAGLDWR
jgi:RNA polymerase sigma factor (sigma-70 family)